MNGRVGAQFPGDLRETLDRWLDLWNVPDLEAKSRIEWSPRLTRSLGRCYPDRRLIRISAQLESTRDGLLQEVLCHEMAPPRDPRAPDEKRTVPRYDLAIGKLR
jgi:hypothetical protein